MRMQVQIMYFGMLAEATGMANETFEVLDNSTVAQFRDQLVAKHQKLAEMQFKIAVNEELAATDLALPPEAKIALLPPFAGG